jgi:glutamate racemase
MEPALRDLPDPLSVLVTDSGLGGLSVCAELAGRLGREGAFRRVALTYFNAWPEQDRGYNLLPADARIRAFDGALLGMARLRPDLILVACNTLSVLYPETRFSRAPAMPVIEILTLGVRMLHALALARPESQVVLFGTPTTIASDAHRSRLVALGVDPGRIVAQACDRLAGEIEKDPDSAVVRGMIERYAGAAAARLADRGAPVLAAFCCTHYNYSAGWFRQAFQGWPGPVTVVNPNDAMSGCLSPDPALPDRPGAELSVRVLSRIVLSGQKVAAIAGRIRPVSARTAQALVEYRHDPDLFAF